MKVIALLLGVAAAWDKTYTLEDIRKIDTLLTFKEWTQAFGRSYESPEVESKKFLIWLDNLQTIAASNSMNKSYTLGLNQFSDMNGDEFRHYIHGDNGACFTPQYHQLTQELLNIPDETAPDSVDWTTKGVVTPVKNQGSCGSCWAFATTGVLECDYAIKTGTLNSLSEQQLVDCAGSYGCDGCNGGNNENAMNYVHHAGGLCSESEYSYTAKDGICKSSSCGTKFNANSGYTRVQKDSSPAMQTATAAGCVAIGIEADQTAFQHYTSGVLTGTCGTRVDHAVLIVGYGNMNGQDYWKVKNSWGASWGMNGYILICRNCNKNGNEGECGILSDGSFPTF